MEYPGHPTEVSVIPEHDRAREGITRIPGDNVEAFPLVGVCCGALVIAGQTLNSNRVVCL